MKFSSEERSVERQVISVNQKLSAVRLRIVALEATMRSQVCNCRKGQETRYHAAADLARILSVRCPVHEERDLGFLLGVPPSTPLHPEDRRLCSCPPCAAREWREGRRGPLTEEEREQEYRSWEQQMSGEAAEQFRRDQARSRQLLQRYLRKRRNQHGTLPGDNQGRKTL